MRGRKEVKLSKVQMENNGVYTQMLESSMNDPTARTLGLVLTAIYARQGEMLQQLQELNGNSWRHR